MFCYRSGLSDVGGLFTEVELRDIMMRIFHFFCILKMKQSINGENNQQMNIEDFAHVFLIWLLELNVCVALTASCGYVNLTVTFCSVFESQSSLKQPCVISSCV